MYHCHIHFKLIGRPCAVFEIIKKMSPLEHFSHEFSECGNVENGLSSEADVILLHLKDMDVKESVKLALGNKKKECELILLADYDQKKLLTQYLSEITDIWTLPLSEEEAAFRFLKWQQSCKMSKDFWQADQYLEATINNIPNLIWYKDKDGIHKKVNDSFCQTVSKTKKQVEGQGHAYIWDVEHDDPACIESEAEVMRKKQTCVSEELIQAGDGMRILTTYKSPLYNLDGSVMGTVGVAIDVTQERAYEEELVKKNETLEMLFTTMDCGVLCHTVDGSRIISVNGAALRILGYDSQEELMETGFHLIAPSVVQEDRAKLQESIHKLKKEGDSVSVEYRVQHCDGEILYILGNIKLLREQGELYYQRFLFDCTAQKVKEKTERMKAERRHTELVQALSIDYNLVCFFDLDTGRGYPVRTSGSSDYTIDSVFDREISLKEVMEDYIHKYVCEEDRELLRQAASLDGLKKELAEKNLYYVNYRISVDGDMRYVQMKVVRTGDWSKWHGIVVGFRSVDEEIRNEMEQKSLLEEALMQAKKANKAKSVFLSNMSHDIRTPMNAIVGFTNLALSHMDQTEQVESYLKKIMTSGNHLLSLINDILDMSRIESGKMSLEEKPCNLADILQGLQNIIQADVHAKRLELHMDAVDVSHEDICCDKLRLNQVLLNLLSNSVKYTPPGGAVSLRLTERPGAPLGSANYEFYIKDTGIGMSEEFVSHIFEPFERERNSTISKIQGTGLGMAITKNLIDMMNGSITVKSEQNAGTEITVSFTFRLAASAHSGESLEDSNHPEASSLHAGRILLAEDVDLNQEIATVILEEAGFSVEVAENGQVALDMLQRAEPGYYQLILMDIQMPVMDGYEATRFIRRLENQERASIPIIAMSANAFEEDKREALSCGMNGHIAKPIDITVLFDTLNKILS